jgi:Xaa-Pro aminopeptidase
LRNHSLSQTRSKYEQFRTCSIGTYLAAGLEFLDTADRPPLEEYVECRNNLAKALAIEGIDVFVVEPGYTFSYYANITQPQWGSWEPEERPFLMVLRPRKVSSGGCFSQHLFCRPSFRGRTYAYTITYEEHYDHYTTLYTSEIWHEILSPVLTVDEEVRDSFQRGLSSTGFTVTGLGGEVEAVRQVKGEHEIGIIKAVNTGTVEAIRALRPCIYCSATENEVREARDETLRAAGFDPFFDLVELGVSAALPHRGYDITRELEPGMLTLIDVGAHLYGYSSDVTRTFYPPFLLFEPSVSRSGYRRAS